MEYIKAFKEKYGLNYVITLLNDKEMPEKIKNKVLSLEMHWSNIQLTGAKEDYLRQKKTVELLVEELFKIYENLVKNERIRYKNLKFTG